MKEQSKNRLLSSALTLGASALAVAPADTEAAATGFLKIEGIDGESQDPGHKNWLELESFSWGLTVPTDGGTITGAPRISQLTLGGRLDKSSPLLALRAVEGEVTPEVTVEVVPEAPAEEGFSAYRMTLSDVIITSFEQSFEEGSADEVPAQMLKITFAKIDFSYRPVDGSGEPLEPVTAQLVK